MVLNRVFFRDDSEIEPYNVKLDIFEGPLDLLLYLIRKEEIDIYDIPIARITKQYLEYVELLRILNLDQAGDFMVMAATLMQIKSQMLLPRGEEEVEEEDPREELVRRLLEYQKYKELSQWLDEKEQKQREVFYRAGVYSDEDGEIEQEELHPVTLFDLLTAFKKVLDNVPKVVYHRIAESEVSIEERIEFILAALEKRGRATFLDLVSGVSRIAMVVTFIAMLELIKTQRIAVKQSRLYGDIWIYRGGENSGAHLA